MKNFILPKDERLKKSLDRQYKEEELRYDHPKLKSKFFKENPINIEGFQQRVSRRILSYFSDRKFKRNVVLLRISLNVAGKPTFSFDRCESILFFNV